MNKLNILFTTTILCLMSPVLFAQETVKLDEVTVKPNNAKEIVLTAFQKIAQNYPEEANYLEVEYQEEVQKNGEKINHYQAQSRLYSQSYQEEIKLRQAHKNYYDKAEPTLEDFIAARWYNELTASEEKAKILSLERKTDPNLEVTISGGPAGLLAYDKVKYRSHFMSNGKENLNHRSFKNQFKNYEFSFVGEEKMNDRLVYVIAFKPKANLDKKVTTFSGEMRIDAESKAFVAFDYQSNNAKQYGFAKNVIENKKHQVSIRYQLHEEKWQLAKIEVKDEIAVYDAKGTLENTYQTNSAMEVKQIVGENVKTFAPQEALANSLSSKLAKYYVPYNNVAVR